MKVLFINRVMGFWQGGGEIFDLNIARELQKLGCEVKFITGKPLFGNPRHPINEFETFYIPTPYIRDIRSRIPIRGLGRFFLLDFWLFSKKVICFLKKYLSKENVDIIQINGEPFLAKRIISEFDIPSVVVFHGFPDRWQLKAIRNCSVVVSLGDALKTLREIRSDIIEIPPGVNSRIFIKVNSDEIRRKYKIGEDKLLLFIGRLIPIKNIFFLLDVFRETLHKYRNIKLMIVGEGKLKEKLQDKVKKEKLTERIVFTGQISHDELPKCYSAADIFTIPSLYETFPIVVLEAMACELPIIGTKVGGIPMQVEDGENGFLVKANDLKGMEEAVLRLLRNEAMAKEMGLRNREKVLREYSWEKSAKKLLKIYEDLLKKGNQLKK